MKVNIHVFILLNMILVCQLLFLGPEGHFGPAGALFVTNFEVMILLLARYSARMPLSLGLVHLLAVLLILVVAPFSIYLTGERAEYDFFSTKIDESLFALAQLSVLLFLLSFVF